MAKINKGGQLVELYQPLVMGVINVTPDSFYAASRKTTIDEILETARTMIRDGAAILDIGGYSSRPGAQDISLQQELERIIEPVEAIKKALPGAFISIDTFRPEVATQAVAAGAGMINDISGIMDAALVAKLKVPYVCMHMRGTPQTMQLQAQYKNLLAEVYAFLYNRLQDLHRHGVNDVIIDPGIGFAKTIEQNYELLNNLEVFTPLNAPILIGISRKSFIYKKLGIAPEEALAPTLALYNDCIKKGARIIRTHDVKETIEYLKKKE